VARAFQIASDIGAQVELAHVFAQNAMDELRTILGVESGDIEERLKADARQHLYDYIAEQGARHRAPARVHLASGAVTATLAALAEALQAGLIVVGAKGEGLLERMILGSTAERLIRHARRPVLMVRRPVERPYETILAPVDFSPSSLLSARLARALAPDAALTLLHAYQTPFESKLRLAGVGDDRIEHYRAATEEQARAELDELARSLERDGAPVSIRLIHGPATQCILEEEKQTRPDLIVLGKQGRGMLEDLLIGSVSKHILSDSGCDVAVVSRGS
jgi:nucleotide-binding universal stress UspA family protein